MPKRIITLIFVVIYILNVRKIHSFVLQTTKKKQIKKLK
jgi:hypothetical protein